jgi:hydroxymethylglutaryl-CoA lyase
MLSVYPKTFTTFMKWCSSNPHYKKIYEGLGNLVLYDVTLRDGLQGLNQIGKNTFTTFKKTELYSEIMEKHSPKSIESGSFVSNKIYPIFKDTVDVHQYIERDKSTNKRDLNNYVFIPNYDKCVEVVTHKYFSHFSFITSVSNSFLVKNIRKTAEKNWEELSEIVYLLDCHFTKRENYKTKIYVSCVTECPIDGKLSNDFIVEKITQMNTLHFDTICLSDTCGSMHLEDFTYIVDKCNELGVPYDAFSLHLHVKPSREKLVEKIIFAALDRKILQFDVSYLETGGCSVTVKKDAINPNMSYELYYQALVKYILDKSEQKEE